MWLEGQLQTKQQQKIEDLRSQVVRILYCLLNATAKSIIVKKPSGMSGPNMYSYISVVKYIHLLIFSHVGIFQWKNHRLHWLAKTYLIYTYTRKWENCLTSVCGNGILLYSWDWFACECYFNTYAHGFRFIICRNSQLFSYSKLMAKKKKRFHQLISILDIPSNFAHLQCSWHRREAHPMRWYSRIHYVHLMAF